MVLSQISDIRSIGILPTIWKAMERAIKQIMQEVAPSTINIGAEQAGFTPQVSTYDHTVNVI